MKKIKIFKFTIILYLATVFIMVVTANTSAQYCSGNGACEDNNKLTDNNLDMNLQS